MPVPGHHAVHVHLGRAGLAAHVVAGQVGVFAAAQSHHVLQERAHRLGGRRANGMAHHLRLSPLDDVPLGVRDLLDDVGLHQVSAVHRGAHRPQQLQRRHRHGLAEADAGDVHPLHGAPGNHNALGLAGDVHPGLLPDAKGL